MPRPALLVVKRFILRKKKRLLAKNTTNCASNAMNAANSLMPLRRRNMGGKVSEGKGWTRGGNEVNEGKGWDGAYETL